MPGACAAHRKSAQDNPCGVDPVLSCYRGEGFIDVDLARPAVGVVGSAEDMQLEVFAGGGLGGIMFGQEADLAEAAVASVQNQVKAKRGLPIVVLRYYEAVGLDTAVDLRAVGARQPPGGLQPGGFSGLESRGAFETGVEHLQRFLDVALVVELSRVTQQPFARLGVDLRIEEAVLRDSDHPGFFPEPVEAFPQFFEFSPDLPELFFGRDIGIRGAGPPAWKAGQYA